MAKKGSGKVDDVGDPNLLLRSSTVAVRQYDANLYRRPQLSSKKQCLDMPKTGNLRRPIRFPLLGTSCLILAISSMVSASLTFKARAYAATQGTIQHFDASQLL